MVSTFGFMHKVTYPSEAYIPVMKRHSVYSVSPLHFYNTAEDKVGPRTRAQYTGNRTLTIFLRRIESLLG
jgi:coenzyme F420-reducing hydrogenase alpha subunit